MTSGSPPSCPFVAGSKIEDSWRFVGRQDELHAIASRMSGVQPTSVNVVGDKRIGKSSLLYHFSQTWEQRVPEPSRYVVVYLSLQDADCHTEEGFYQAVAEALLSRVSGWKLGLRNPLKAKPLHRQAFSDAIKQWKQQGVLPVLCLDDFESLLKRTEEFDNGFYDNLRSLMDDNALMLVVASRKELSVYGSEHRFVSQFFNLGHVLKLEDLTTDEAIQLVRLPASSVSSAPPVLSGDEQRHAENWGKRHPYFLQLAGSCLWEARQQNKDMRWAKAEFEQQSSQFKSESNRQWWRPLRWLVWDLPVGLGRVAKFIGGSVDDVTNWIIGFVILILLVLVVVGVLRWEQVKDLLQQALGR
jgi:hypothetical protein